MGNLDSLQADQLPQALRQVFGRWHGRAVDENRNDANAAVKRSLDLDPNEVFGIVDAATVVSVDARNPLCANDGDERVADGHAFGQQLDKINAGRNAIDVKEDVLAT